MVAAVETMAWVHNKPWHGHPNQVPEGLPVEEFLQRAGIDWTVRREKLYLKDGTYVPGRYALVRDSDNKVISNIGPQHKPRQNSEAFKIFERFIASGKMTMETAGSLMGGLHVWGLAKMGRSFALPGNDEIENYLLVHQPHFHRKSTEFLLTPTEVVCMNTLSIALSGATKNAIIRVSHARDFNDDMQDKVVAALGLLEEQIDKFAEAAQFLASKKASKEQVEDYFCNVLDFDKAKAKTKKDGEPRVPRLLPMFQEALDTGPSVAVNRGTWWHALGAVTYTIDHVANENRADRLATAWFGRGADQKRKALQTALKMAA
jgi:phage/plasmid-like protein (TIGR03299 family)